MACLPVPTIVSSCERCQETNFFTAVRSTSTASAPFYAWLRRMRQSESAAEDSVTLARKLELADIGSCEVNRLRWWKAKKKSVGDCRWDGTDLRLHPAQKWGP